MIRWDLMRSDRRLSNHDAGQSAESVRLCLAQEWTWHGGWHYVTLLILLVFTILHLRWIFHPKTVQGWNFGLRTVPPERHLYLISWSSRPYKMQCEQSNTATAEWEPDPFKAYAVDFYEQVAHSIKLMYVYLYTLYLLRCNVCNICIFV